MGKRLMCVLESEGGAGDDESRYAPLRVPFEAQQAVSSLEWECGHRRRRPSRHVLWIVWVERKLADEGDAGRSYSRCFGLSVRIDHMQACLDRKLAFP